MRELYELRGSSPEVLFSPYCWRVRLALAHKGLDFVSRPVRFTDKEALAFSGQTLVPVLRDGETTVHDSLAIFRYLDERYPQPSLLGGALGESRLRLIDRLIGQDLRPALVRLLLPRVLASIDPPDRDYFRQTREKSLGMSLEAFADRDAGQAQLARALQPLDAMLKGQSWLDGAEPAGADYLIGGFFFWAWTLGEQPWPGDSPTGDWFRRLLAFCEERQGAVRRATND
ncbi:glutathione S-transferase family protein [Azotobacter vinelandii]|uniref:glutathione S-transferase N-terminal domain-containing protein n=1 Tax=Azotobacter vinelandii TaxID=354 RepID=UPI000AE12454|nr:glutathione S-transferase family protein [Azotobacter vinelandii]